MSRSYSKRLLSHPEMSSLPPSMPLIIPNDREYDVSTNELRQIPAERRTCLKIVPETLRLLETIKRPVAVMSICGPCRTGKSYVLSRMLGSADDFALGHTMDAKTFGIWIGTTVLDCDQFTLLLMDTEGIDCVSATMKDDASVLVMTALLSSCLIYNSLGVPKHNDLQKMSHFAHLATSIAVKNAEGSSEDKDDAFELKNHFPDFVWLLRDVILIPTDEDGKEVSPTEYLMTRVLKRSKSFKESQSDQIGRAILTVFPSVECRSIQPPSSDPTLMRDIAAKQDCLDPKFNKQVEEVVQYLLQCVRAKKGIQSSKMADGPILAAMATHYLEAVNNPDAIPCISDTWQTAITMRCKKVKEQLLKEYDDEMKAKIAEVGLPMEEDLLNDTKPHTLLALHRLILLQKTTSLLKQVGHFITGSVISAEINISKESLIAELEQGAAIFTEEISGKEIQGTPVIRKKVTGGLLLTYAQRNFEASRLSCNRLFEKLYGSIEEKMKGDRHSYSFDDLTKDLNTLQVTYYREAVGPAKWEVYNEKRSFIKTQESSFKTLQGFKKKAFDAQQKAADASAKATELQNSVETLQAQMRNDAEMNLQRIKELEKHHQDEMEKFRAEEKERTENERRRSENFMKAQMELMADMVKTNSEQSQKHFHTICKSMDQMMKDNQESIRNMTKAVEKLSVPPPPGPDTLGTILGVIKEVVPVVRWFF